jgi:hypothetical protein
MRRASFEWIVIRADSTSGLIRFRKAAQPTIQAIVYTRFKIRPFTPISLSRVKSFRQKDI